MPTHAIPQLPTPISQDAKLSVAFVYEHFSLHPILQEHMWRVASLMSLLLEHWIGPPIRPALLIETMLLHDLGNLIKFDLRPDAPHHLMQPAELPFYRELQALWREKYGLNVDHATNALIQLMPLQHKTEITQKIMQHAAGTLAETVQSTDWEQKLCDYTDFRIGPHGILTLAERFADLAQRYRYRDQDWQNEADVTTRLELFQTLEIQLQSQLSLDLNTLTTAQLEPIDRWKSYVFAHLT